MRHRCLWPADEALKGKITDVEAGLKADKEKKVVAYFDELVKANGVEWVSYEDIGIAVTMTASLKSLKSKVKEYVDRVVADVNCINGMENAPEVMAEYKQCRNLAVAINSVSQRKDRVAREEAERKQRLEAQLRAQEAESAVLDAVEEELAAPQVMGTEPPVMDEAGGQRDPAGEQGTGHDRQVCFHGPHIPVPRYIDPAPGAEVFRK